MTFIRFTALVVLLIGALTRPLRAQVSLCRGADNLGQSLHKRLQTELSSTADLHARNRQAIGLATVSAEDVQIVADTAMCRRAVEAYDSLRVHHGQGSQQRPVYVIKAASIYLVIDPEARTGEWYDCLVFTDQWAYLKTLLL